MLKIPYARRKNPFGLVPPESASKEEEYDCPECLNPVTFRKGVKNTPHFAHYADTECTHEGIIHKTAKTLLYSIYYTSFHRLKKPVVAIRRKCKHCEMKAWVKHPDWFCDIGSVRCEYSINGVRADVLVIERTSDITWSPALAIEIRSKHPVPYEKWDKMMEAKIPCIEVEAQDIIDEWTRGMFLSDCPRFMLKPVKQNLYIHNQPDNEGVIGSRLPFINCPKCCNT